MISYATAVALSYAASVGWAAPPGTVAAGRLPTPVPSPSAAPSDDAAPLQLSLVDAVTRGLERNLAVLLSERGAEGAAGAARSARAKRLPDLAVEASEARTKINLEAYGLPVAPGESPLIGPFNVFDARISSSMPLLDSAVNAGARSEQAGAKAARAAVDDVRDEVVLGVSSLYLQAVAAEARVITVRSEVSSAESLARQARDMKSSGVVARVDVLRAEVQLASERQRLIVAENEAATRKLALARAIGVPLSRSLQLVDRPVYRPAPPMPLDTALERAYAHRGDLESAEAAVEAASEGVRAARGEGLPSLALHGDVGRIGPAPSGAETTFTVAARIRVPLFTGGAVQGRVEQAKARLAEREAIRDDLRERIELEVRTALLDLEASDARVKVAEGAAGVADAQLEQTRDRFAAGVSSGVEVVQAQEAVATAHDNAIASLLAFNRARVALARALGLTAEDMNELLGGEQ